MKFEAIFRQGARAMIVVLTVMCGVKASAQWDAGLTVALATPGASSRDAAQLRTAFAGGLMVSWRLPSHPRWGFRGDFIGVRQLSVDSPDTAAVPLDAALHVVRFQMVPFTVGMDCRLPMGRRWCLETSCGVGAYWRFVDSQRLRSSTDVVCDYDQGLGLALQAGVALAYASRLAVEMHVVALGNPLGKDEAKVPQNKGEEIQYTINRHNLEDYRQLFFLVGLAYRIPFTER